MPPPTTGAADKSEFDQEDGTYTRSQSLEAGSFAVFIGGKRIPVRVEHLLGVCRPLFRQLTTTFSHRQVNQVALALGGAVVLLIVIVSLIASSGGGDSGPAAAVIATGYTASFSSLCGKSPADMNLEMAKSYECARVHGICVWLF